MGKVEIKKDWIKDWKGDDVHSIKKDGETVGKITKNWVKDRKGDPTYTVKLKETESSREDYSRYNSGPDSYVQEINFMGEIDGVAIFVGFLVMPFILSICGLILGAIFFSAYKIGFIIGGILGNLYGVHDLADQYKVNGKWITSCPHCGKRIILETEPRYKRIDEWNDMVFCFPECTIGKESLWDKWTH